MTVAWYLAHQQWIDTIIDGSYGLYYDKMYRDRG